MPEGLSPSLFLKISNPKIEYNIAIKRSFAVGKIWVERGATERNLLIAVKLSEGLNFSATFRSEAEEKFKVVACRIKN